MNKQILVAMFCSVVMTPAFAESQFSGPYAGVQIGYAEGDDEGREYYDGAPTSYTQNTSPEGEFFGLSAGFNKVLNDTVLLGIEVDYDFRGEDDSSLQKSGGVEVTNWPVKTEVKEAASIRGRLGYVFNDDQTLVYVTGGYSLAKIKRQHTSLSQPGVVSSDSAWNDGWVAGLGLEHFIASNLSASIEYRYAEYSTEHMNASALWGDGTVENQDYDEEAIRIGIAYHF